MSIANYDRLEREAWLFQVLGLDHSAGQRIRSEALLLEKEGKVLYARRGSGPDDLQPLHAIISFDAILSLRAGAPISATVNSLLNAEGSRPLYRSLDRNVFQVRIPAQNLEELKAAIFALEDLSEVEHVDPYTYYPNRPATLPAHADEVSENPEDVSSVLGLGCLAGRRIGLQEHWSHIGIKSVWERTTATGSACGQGVRVAVIDHGFAVARLQSRVHLDAGSCATFGGSAPSSRDLTDLGGSSEPLDSHGNDCVGLIGARQADGELDPVNGAAPACTLSLIRIRESDLVCPQQLAQALHFAALEGNAKIVSCSLVPQAVRITSPELEKVLADCTLSRQGQGTLLCFAAPYSSGRARSEVGWTYPGHVLLVGSCVFLETGAEKTLGVTGLDLLAPQNAFSSLSASGFTGTSASAPMVAGAAALLAGFFPRLNAAELRAALTTGAALMPHQAASPPPHIAFGCGRLNVEGAFLKALAIDQLKGP